MTSKKVLTVPSTAEDLIWSKDDGVDLVDKLSLSLITLQLLFYNYHIYISSDYLFTFEHARKIFQNQELLNSGISKDLIFGGEPVLGLRNKLRHFIHNCEQGNALLSQIDRLEAERIQKGQGSLARIEEKLHSEKKKVVNQIKKSQAESDDTKAYHQIGMKITQKILASAKKNKDATMLATYKQKSLYFQQAFKELVCSRSFFHSLLSSSPCPHHNYDNIRPPHIVTDL